VDGIREKKGGGGVFVFPKRRVLASAVIKLTIWRGDWVEIEHQEGGGRILRLGGVDAAIRPVGVGMGWWRTRGSRKKPIAHSGTNLSALFRYDSKGEKSEVHPKRRRGLTLVVFYQRKQNREKSHI